MSLDKLSFRKKPVHGSDVYVKQIVKSDIPSSKWPKDEQCYTKHLYKSGKTELKKLIVNAGKDLTRGVVTCLSVVNHKGSGCGCICRTKPRSGRLRRQKARSCRGR